MERNKLIMGGMAVGSILGGMLPSLWGDSVFSLWSVLFTALGGALGIWLTFSLSK